MHLYNKILAQNAPKVKFCSQLGHILYRSVTILPHTPPAFGFTLLPVNFFHTTKARVNLFLSARAPSHPGNSHQGSQSIIST